jgi:hypothetical protein
MGLPTNYEDIDIFVDDPPNDCPPDPASEPMIDDFDIFQRNIMSYSQLMSQMTLNLSVGTTGI